MIREIQYEQTVRKMNGEEVVVKHEYKAPVRKSRGKRIAQYVTQNGRRGPTVFKSLTPKQLRRLKHKNLRKETNA